MSEAPPSQLPKKKVQNGQGLQVLEGSAMRPIDLLDLSDLEEEDCQRERKRSKRVKAGGGPLYQVKWFR